MKLDFEKSYHKISWSFLFDCLKNRGFNHKWCNWIEKVVKKGTLSVQVYNEVGPYFQSRKGIRKGDPLSPFLFNLAAVSFAKMIKMAQQSNLRRVWFTILYGNQTAEGKRFRYNRVFGDTLYSDTLQSDYR